MAAIDRSVLSNARYKAPVSFAATTEMPCYLTYSNPQFNYIRISMGLGATPNEPPTSEESLKIEMPFQRDRPLALEARGVLDPRGNGQIVDLVEIEPFNVQSAWTYFSRGNPKALKYQFYVTRGPKPSIVEYRLIPVAVRSRTDYHNGVSAHEFESIEIKDLQPFRCLVQ